MKTVKSAEHDRDTGMERAIDHAEREILDWGQGAHAVLMTVAANMPAFLAEDVVAASKSHGLAPPPDGRAWGAVVRRAALKGLIHKIGYAPARSSNLSPKCLWARS